MPAPWDRRQIVRVLADPRLVDWAPLYILVLGRLDDPAAATLVRRSLEALARMGAATNLGAWSVAFAETEGPAAIDRLTALYREDRGRTPEELRALIAALETLAAGGDPAVRAPARRLLGDIAVARPEVAGSAARALAGLGDRSRAEAIARAVAAEPIADPAEALAVQLYLDGVVSP